MSTVWYFGRMKDLPYFNQAFGQVLRARREAAGINQRELAYRIEGVRSYVQSLEYGRQTPTATTIILIAEALGIDPSEMLRDSVQVMERLSGQTGDK
jgi:transcriptional regulator with XRE-family HTH domain